VRARTPARLKKFESVQIGYQVSSSEEGQIRTRGFWRTTPTRPA